MLEVEEEGTKIFLNSFA